MILTPAQSWLLLLGLFGSVVLGIWIASRPTRASLRRSRRITDDLDELQRLERARQAIGRAQASRNVRLGYADGHLQRDKEPPHEQ